jgi:hypothetical protein
VTPVRGAPPPAVTAVHVVVPAGIDDPVRPSGGNNYDRRVCDGLAAIGWPVHEHPVVGDWPRPDRSAQTRLAGVLAGLADGAVVLLDGLVASAVPDVLLPEADRSPTAWSSPRHWPAGCR